jgi:hypothetical protein
MRMGRSLFLAGLLVAILLAGLYLNLGPSRQSLADSKPYQRYSGAAAWLQANTPQGAGVFQSDWDAVQATARPAGIDLSFGCLRRLESSLGGEGDEAVELRVKLLHLPDASLGQLHGRELPGSDLGGSFMQE